MYKGFAIAVLLGAPILVMLADEVTPKNGAPLVAQTSRPVDAPVKETAKSDYQPVQAPTPPPPSGIFPGMTSSVGAPMADAGKPMLDPNMLAPTAAAPVASSTAIGQPDPGAALTAEWHANRK